MDPRGAWLAGVLTIAAACAHPPPSPPAPSGSARPPPVSEAPSPPADLLDEESPVGYVANEKADTAACNEIFAQFNEAWTQARPCERDTDCAIWFNSCTAARADFKELLDRKLRAAGECVKMISISRCIDSRAICFARRCRARGRYDRGDGGTPG